MTNVRSVGRNILLGCEDMQTVKSGNYDDHPYLLSGIDKKAFQSGDAKISLHSPITSYSSLQVTYKTGILEYQINSQNQDFSINKGHTLIRAKDML